MSRKKVKKEVVKRKTNIYDPMGVYGRGLTENQRLGMTRQMKIENIRNPEKKITKGDLEEYRKLLEFYGMYKSVPVGHIRNLPITYTFVSANIYTNDSILQSLDEMDIHPQFFVCDTFVIQRPYDTTWNTSLYYRIKVGNSEIRTQALNGYTRISTNDSSVTIPRWFILDDAANYFQLRYDDDQSDMYIHQNMINISDAQMYPDMVSLPHDGTPIPYLIYPNTSYPELSVQVGRTNPLPYQYYVTFNVLVIY